MKKSIAILLVMALVAVAASAQVTVGGWGRTMFVPVANSGATDAKNQVSNVPSWDWGNLGAVGGAAGAGSGRVGATIAGNSDNVGFQIDLNGDGGTINEGDETKMWVKPISMLKIAVGRAQDDTLRGNAAFGSFGWYRAYGSGAGEDTTFSRLSTGIAGNRTSNNRQGVILTATPVDALFVAVALRDINKSDTACAGNLTENLFTNGQYAAGYTIAGVGQIRAQYISTYNLAADDTQGEFEAAFKVSAVKDLYADIGFKMTTNKDLDDTEAKNISVYANYKVAGATVHGLAIVNLYKDVAADSSETSLNIGAGADYGLSNGIGLSADVRYWDKNANGGTDAKTTIFAGVTKGFSNGVFGAGVEIVSAADMGYAIPVRFEYWF